MTEQSFFWILGIVVTIVLAIGGALWKHIVEDAKVRERLASLETDNASTKTEVKSLRERFHDFRDGTMKDVYKLFQEWKAELIERFEKKRNDRRNE